MLKTKEGEELLMLYVVGLIQVYKRRSREFEDCIKKYLADVKEKEDVLPRLNGFVVGGEELATHFLVLTSDPLPSINVLQKPREREVELRLQVKKLIGALKKLGVPHQKPSPSIANWLDAE